MLKKAALYLYTVRTMKPSQLYYRIMKRLGISCSISCVASKTINWSAIHPVATVDELDYDPAFLARFPADDFLQDEVVFLHHSRRMDWQGQWDFTDETHLWNYNLHYFEYLFTLVNAYRKTGNDAYMEKAQACISGWIVHNPSIRGGLGWEPYTLALRLTNWLSFWAKMKEWFVKKDAFEMQFLGSIHEQYRFLAQHVEKDLLGNHYFEDLKALLLCALFFQDKRVLKTTLREFKKQCREQILFDGMHFELSPMYQHIILEDMLRVAVALRKEGCRDDEIESYLQPMLDAAYSLTEGLERLPLFNDCGNNVAKSLSALLAAAKFHFGLEPHFKTKLPESGYYIFKQNDWKLIVDGGQPGPEYIPGHAHCDAMSFELFKAGKPVLVNCGTYAYQSEERNFFRSTAAHNTVMINGVEQSECWGNFRLAKRARVQVSKVEDDAISLQIIDQSRNMISRYIKLRHNGMDIIDTAEGDLQAYLHFGDDNIVQYETEAKLVRKMTAHYATEFGLVMNVPTVEIFGRGRIWVRLKW